MRAPCASTTWAATAISTHLRSRPASIVPTRRVRRIDHPHAGLLEFADLGHFGIAQLEVEDRQIGGEVIGIGRARDRDDAVLHEITQRDLRGALAVALADAREHLVAGHLAAPERAISRDCQAVAATGGKHLALVDERMDLDLVRHQRFARELHRLLQQRDGEIRDPDMLGAPVAFGLAQNAERLLQRHLRTRPMDEKKVDPGKLELLQALIERALEVGGGKLIVIDLGSDENMLALEAGGAQPATQSLTDLALIAVALGGVDVAIADTERGLDRVDAGRVHERHGAEPDRGNPCAVGFDEIHGMPPPLRSALEPAFPEAGRRSPDRVTNSDRLLDAPPAPDGYWMPRFRGAGQPYFRRRQVLRTRSATLKIRIIQ